MTGNLPIEQWRGDFGNAYVERNLYDEAHHKQRLGCWSRLLGSLGGAAPASILEVGSNIGLNLRALKQLTMAELYAVEPNAAARAKLVDEGTVAADHAFDASADKIPLPDNSVDLAFTYGVLIHIPPVVLTESCAELVRVSRRYIVCVEYFNDRPIELPYHGNTGMLFRRDFGGFYLDNWPQLEIVESGFFWSRQWDQDNLTWWIFRKNG